MGDDMFGVGWLDVVVVWFVVKSMLFLRDTRSGKQQVEECV